MICGRLMLMAAAVAGLMDAISAFSFITPQPSKQGIIHMFMQWRDNDVADDERLHIKSSRREFFSKIATVAATAPILLTGAPQAASSATADVTNEPTRIELSVDTEYLIRVLEYFDGDMRKVLGALVRSPQTTVEILPPPPAKRGIYKDSKEMSPEDAILRALYSYNAPEDYAAQASWLKVDEPDKGWVAALTKKRYTIQLPSLGSSDVGGSNIDGGEEGASAEVVIQPTAIGLSNLEAGVGLGVLSYPVAYSYYNYERNREEQEKKAKKAKMAAKKAAKAKAAGASKKKSNKKGTPKKENAVAKKAKSEEVTKKKQQRPPAMKGQERKKDGGYIGDNAQMPTKKATAVTKPVTNMDRIASEMIDSQRENFIAATAVTKPSTNSDRLATEMIDSQRENFIAATAADESKQWWEKPQPEIKPDRVVNELEQLVAAAAAAAAAESAEPSESYQSTATSSGYLDNLSQGSQLDAITPPLSKPAGATGYLDDASLNFSESAQQSALAGSGDDAEGSGAGGGGSITEPPRQSMGTSLRSLVDNGAPKRGPPNNYLDSL